MSDGRLIIVTGTPGTGKTTLAARLAQALPANHVDLPLLVEEEGLWLGVDEERGARLVDLARVRRRLRELAKRGGLNLVVSSHIPGVAYRKDVDAVLVLRLHPCELKRRLEALGWPPPKVRENVAAEALAICLNEALSYYGEGVVHEVDVTDMGVEEAAEYLIGVLRGERGVRRADWLSRAIEDEELARLLASL